MDTGSEQPATTVASEDSENEKTGGSIQSSGVAAAAENAEMDAERVGETELLNQGTAEKDHVVDPVAADVSAGVILLTCRKCGVVQCRESDLLQDEVNSDPSNGSYFLEYPLDWMQDAATNVEGKFNCPGCDARVGRLSWVGYEATPGRWLTPCIMLTRSKVDVKRCDEEYAVSLEAKRDAFFQQVVEETEAEESSADTATRNEDASGTEKSSHQEIRETDNAPSSNVEAPAAPPPPAAAAVSAGEPSSKGRGKGKSKQATLAAAESKREFTDEELTAMDLTELVKLVDSGDLDMDRLVEAMDKAAAKKKEEEKANRDLTDPQVLMKAVAEEIGDKGELLRFKKGCGQYARGDISCQQYFQDFRATLEALDREGLLEHVVRQIGDADKRACLLSTVRAA